MIKKKRKKEKKSLKESIEEFLVNLKTEMSREEISKFSENLYREIIIWSLAIIVITLLSILGRLGTGTIVKDALEIEIPFYLLELFPWVIGAIGGYILVRWRVPKIKALITTFFGSKH